MLMLEKELNRIYGMELERELAAEKKQSEIFHSKKLRHTVPVVYLLNNISIGDVLTLYKSFFAQGILLEIHRHQTLKQLQSKGVRFCEVTKTDTVAQLKWREAVDADRLSCIKESVYGIYVEFQDNNPHLPSLSINILMRSFPRLFYFSELLEPVSGVVRYLFSDVKPARVITQNTTVIFVGQYGDFFITMPVLFRLFELKIVNKLVVPTEEMGRLALKFLPRCTISYMDTTVFSLGNLFDNGHLKSAVHINASRFAIRDMQCVYEVIARRFADGLKMNPQETLDYFLNNSQISFLRASSPWRRGYRYIIGLQRISSTKAYGGFGPAKEWSFRESGRFLELCWQNRIQVVNFEPLETQPEQFNYNLGNLPFHQMLPALRALDLFIGLDSSFNHLCALLKVPNITLFSTLSAQYKQIGLFYIPVAFNYSLIPERFNASRLDADRVFKICYDFLKNRRAVDTTFVSLLNKRPGIHYEIL